VFKLGWLTKTLGKMSEALKRKSRGTDNLFYY